MNVSWFKIKSDVTYSAICEISDTLLMPPFFDKKGASVIKWSSNDEPDVPVILIYSFDCDQFKK